MSDANEILPLCEQLIQIDKRRKSIKAEEEDLKAQREIVETQIMSAVENGVDFQRATLSGVTVYISTDHWPRAKKGKTELMAALKTNGLDAFVREDFNAQTLRGYTNELIRVALSELDPETRKTFDVNQAIPEGLRDYLELSSDHHVKTKLA